MRLIDADALNGYKFGLISPYAQNLFHETINEAPTIDYKQLLEQEPCTDVITISRQALEDAIANTIVNGESLGYAVACDILSDLPPVTLAEKPNKWMADDVLNHWIGVEVLDRIRNELHATAEKHEDGVYYFRDEWIDEVFDKYKDKNATIREDDKCQSCEKDWTKCTRCPVMMKWVKEHKKEE